MDQMIRGAGHNRAGDGGAFVRREASERRPALDYLRTFAVVLVLLHHAVHAYATFASINLESPIKSASPVVNELRWVGFDLIVAFNETFFMPLMFFISGLFVWQSLARKGIRKYLTGRMIRLGLPFVFGVFFLIPLAYYPAQLQVGQITGVDMSYGAFWLAIVRSGVGTAGPLWFLWVLLAFDSLAALLYRIAPLCPSLIKRQVSAIFKRPAAFSTALIGLSILVYVPMAIIIGPLAWIGFGPFHAQASRLLLYLLYFLAGTGIGAYGIDSSALRPDGTLAKYWRGWLAAGLTAFVVFIIMVAFVTAGNRGIASETAFAVCCGAMVIGLTGLFLRVIKRRGKIFDSLSDNAYGIYLVHYGFVTWLQYLLLGSPLDPVVKGAVVFLGTVMLSWAVAAAVRRIPAVGKII